MTNITARGFPLPVVADFFVDRRAGIPRLIAQAFGAAGLVPALGIAAALVAIPAALSLALVWIFGRETRGRDLRDLESSPGRRVSAIEAVRGG